MQIRTAVRRGAALAAVLLLVGCMAGAPLGGGPGNSAAAPATVTPRSALGSYLAARQAQEDRDYRDAARFMNRALTADPSNIELTRYTLLLQISEGQVGAAAGLAKRLVAQDGNRGMAALVLLVEEIKAGDFDAAAHRVAAMPPEGAERYAAPLLAAWIDAGRHDPAKALKALDRLKDLRGLEPLRDLHVALIEDFADRVDAAAATYAKLIAEQPQPSWRLVEVAGNFYERHGRSAAARRLYERYAAIDSETDAAANGLARIAKGAIPPRVVATPQQGAAEALFDLASLLNRSDTIDAALIYDRLSLELAPDFALAQILAGQIREQQDHVADAIVLYRAVGSSSPLYWSAQLHAAMALDAMGHTDEAKALLTTMAKERPTRAAPLTALGDLLRAHNQFADAVRAYDAAFARVGGADASWRLYYSRGVALERSGQWTRAEADLKHALSLAPDEPVVLNYLGYSWIDRNENLPQALKMVERAVQLRPNDGYFVDSLGWAFYRLGDLTKATRLLEHAIELLPEDPTINDHLGDVYWRTGRLVEARYQWRRALLFKPEADEVRGIEMKLDHGLSPPTAAARGG